MEENKTQETAKRLEALIETKAQEMGVEYKKEAEEKLTALHKEIIEKEQKANKRLDSIEMQAKAFAPISPEKNKMIGDELFDKITQFKNGGLQSVNGDLELQTKGLMSQSGSFTGQVVQPTQLTPIYNDPFADPTRARNLVANGTTGETNAVTFTTGLPAVTDAPPATVLEAAEKPQTEFNFIEKTFPVQVIATHATVSNQMLSDRSQLQSWIQAIMIQRILGVEDEQIINGTGLTSNLTGLIKDATTVTQANSGAATDAAATDIDCIRAGLSYLAKTRYRADAILLNPADFYNLVGTKNGELFLLDNVASYDNNGGLRIYGIPVIAHNSITEGACLMGAFRSAYLYLMREGLNVRFFEQHADNATKNLQTIRVEFRAVGVPLLPSAIAKFTFSTLKTDLGA